MSVSLSHYPDFRFLNDSQKKSKQEVTEPSSKRIKLTDSKQELPIDPYQEAAKVSQIVSDYLLPPDPYFTTFLRKWAINHLKVAEIAKTPGVQIYCKQTLLLSKKLDEANSCREFNVRANQFFEAGLFEDALSDYQATLKLDKNNGIAIGGMKNTVRQIELRKLENPIPSIAEKNAHFLYEKFCRHIGFETLKKLCLFIEENKDSLFDIVKHAGKNLYIRAGNYPGLERSIQVNQNGTIFIHLNKAKKGDRELGDDNTAKVVKMAIDYTQFQVYASAGMKNQNDLECVNLEAFKGVSGFAQLINKVSYIKNGKEKTRLTLVYYNGGNLDETILIMNDQNKIRIAKDLINAVGEAHKRHFIIRDLKASNVLLNWDETAGLSAIICDLGFGCFDNDEVSMKRISGTYDYFAPEYAKAIESSIFGNLISATTTQIDIWALGLILYELFIDELPWTIDENSDDTEDNLNEKVTKLSNAHNTNWFPEPAQKDSIFHLIWEMTKSKPEDRLSAIEAQVRINRILTRITWV